ncbi:formate/nitrite transporter family protein (plasmid) [Methylocystis parvus OBBP]|uniref:Formate/nitrite transporter family protein n=1 Tax=Methylocystis parvus TaxID=134 RepID=A0A6B8MEL8_9HYPH|nr:formate/nitrite transporter family protein [Methylocystis parvus]QGN00173.1 formate/nitrite transporter family protein [Methylocystis parvus]WBK02519.1 formate/nitrite transporter family protein [Methylocystis parvus OBBP]
MLFRSIPSGFIIAAMVWIIPVAETARFHMVAPLTYLIAIGRFSHIVAGSVEAFFLVLSGELAIGPLFVQFMLPVLVGNIIGGTALFALLSYAQVMSEI